MAKGIAMLAVIFCHSCMLDQVVDPPQTAIEFCFTFHLATFFVVSGYFCKATKVTRESLNKDARALLLPYALTSCVVVAMGTCYGTMDGEGVAAAFIDWLKAAFYGSGADTQGMPAGIGSIGAIWYLLAFFWAKQLFVSIMGMRHPGVWAVLLFLTGMNYGGSLWLPFSVQPALCAVLYMYVGRVLHEEGLLERGAIPVPLLLAMIGIGVYAGLYGGGVYMVENKYPVGSLNVIGSLCLAVLLIKLSRVACEHLGGLLRPLELFGSHTLAILCMHLVFLLLWAGINAISRKALGVEFASWPIAFAINVAGPIALVGLLELMPTWIKRAFGLARWSR